MFNVRMGRPEIENYWEDLTGRVLTGKASKTEVVEYNQLGKTFRDIAGNPKHPGLHTHTISELTERYGKKVWCSYVQNNTPAAKRVYWVYGPDRRDITIIAIEPHPDDKKNSYRKIVLSSMPKT
ncbi:MAG: hypothetical protein IKE69_12120 [Thermoguttaceae bacterium]|nr:hypothetical protein [Thermoguttaceae bacterium]